MHCPVSFYLARDFFFKIKVALLFIQVLWVGPSAWQSWLPCTEIFIATCHVTDAGRNGLRPRKSMQTRNSRSNCVWLNHRLAWIYVNLKIKLGKQVDRQLSRIQIFLIALTCKKVSKWIWQHIAKSWQVRIKTYIVLQQFNRSFRKLRQFHHTYDGTIKGSQLALLFRGFFIRDKVHLFKVYLSNEIHFFRKELGVASNILD